MSSGSALSHLINRNLCYNDLSMSLWLHAYSMRAGDPVALVADFEAFFTHTVALCCLWVQHPTGGREAGTCLAGHTQAKHQLSTSISPVCRVPFCFDNLFFILSTWFQQATYFNVSNLFDQIASIVLCEYVCVCSLSWPVAWCTSPEEQCSGLSLLFE